MIAGEPISTTNSTFAALKADDDVATDRHADADSSEVQEQCVNDEQCVNEVQHIYTTNSTFAALKADDGSDDRCSNVHEQSTADVQFIYSMAWALATADRSDALLFVGLATGV